MIAPDVTVVGIVYIIIGVFGIVENGLTGILIGTDRGMRNPSYFYMVNLCICDVIILISIEFYTGLAMVWPIFEQTWLIKLGAYLAALGWYGGCIFMVLASFSRYVQLEMSHRVDTIFRRRNLYVSTLFAYLIPGTYSCFNLFYDPHPFSLYVDKYTWGFNRSESVGNALSVANVTVNVTFAVLINICNLKSLLWVRRMRRQVQSAELKRNNSKEIKLFAQCAITGSIFTVSAFYYFIIFALEDQLPLVAFLTTHLLWTSIHLINPMIYFVLNNRLRSRCMRIIRCKGWSLSADDKIIAVANNKNVCGGQQLKNVSHK